MGFLKIDAGSDRKNQYINDSLKFRQWEQKTWHHLTSSQQTAGVLTTQATKKTQSITSTKIYTHKLFRLPISAKHYTLEIFTYALVVYIKVSRIYEIINLKQS